jgi:hypothetical protein
MPRIRSRLSFALLLVVLIAPASVQAKGPTRTVSPGQSAVVWTDATATGPDQVAKVVLSASSPAVAMAATTVNAACSYTTYNTFGWVLTRYTLYQTFKYDGTKITYFPQGSKSTEGNWSWYDNGSQDPREYWITSPKSAYSVGNYAFRRDVADFHESKNGWVQVDIRRTGAWWCSMSQP